MPNGRLRIIRDTDIQTIQNNVSKINGCWEWQGALEKGTNQPVYFGHRIRRLFYERMIGRTRKRIGVSCKNSKCINPSHLVTADRVGSAIAPYRTIIPDVMYGENNNNNKLKEEEVLEIRDRFKRGAKQSTLAREYGVHRSTIYHIVNDIQWKWLTPATRTRTN